MYYQDYDVYDYLPSHCDGCDDKEVVLEQAGEYLSAIVKTLYNKENLDLSKLESDLDELCHLLNVKLMQGELQIQRKTELPFLLIDWVNFNANHLKELTHQG